MPDKRKWLSNLVLVGLLGLVLYRQGPVWWHNWNQAGETAKPVGVVALSGQRTVLPPEDHKNSVFIFWATWCGPCKIELSRYKKAVDNNELDGKRLFAINLGEDPALVQRFVHEQQYPFPVYVDVSGDAARQFSVSMTPTVVHVNSEGKIEWASSGISMLGLFKARDFISP